MKTALLSGVLLLSLGLFGLPAYAADLVNINTATQAELETLNGIGPAKAQAIIEYRGGPNGPFETIEEIKEVSGIGDATFEGIKDSITVSGETNIEEQASEDTNESSPQDTTSTTQSSSSSKSSTAPASVRIVASAIVIAGASEEFRGEISKGGEDTKYANYYWNFGDGSVGRGQKIEHAYSRPGKYVVVLLVDTGTAEVEARVTIEAVPLELALILEPAGGLGVSNRSAREVDIGGWILTGGGITFFMPLNTIVLAGETLHFSSETTGITDTVGAQLLYPSGSVAVTAGFSQEPVQAAPPSEPVSQKKTDPGQNASTPEVTEVAVESFTQIQEGLPAAAGVSGFAPPLWSYGLGLAALIVLGVASILFIQHTRSQTATKSLADKFEITEN